MAPRVHFLSLPRELRDEIYELCMLDCPKAAPVDRLLHARWLLVSKQVFFEAAELAYGRTCFFTRADLKTAEPLVHNLEMRYVFGNAPVDLLPAMYTFSHAKTLIKFLAVHLEFMDLEEARPISDKVAQYFHGLNTLSGLQTLYVSFGPQVSLLRHFAPEWLDISQNHPYFGPDLAQAVATLRNLVPRECRIVWSIPPEIRSHESPTTMRYDMFPEGWVRMHVEDVMKAISDSMDATNGA